MLCAAMSPLTIPSIWIWPSVRSAPVICMSPAITESCPARLEAERGRSPPLLFGLDQSNGLARLQELLRILGNAIDEHFVVHMRAGGTAGRAEQADADLAADLLPDIDR